SFARNAGRYRGWHTFALSAHPNGCLAAPRLHTCERKWTRWHRLGVWSARVWLVLAGAILAGSVGWIVSLGTLRNPHIRVSRYTPRIAIKAVADAMIPSGHTSRRCFLSRQGTSSCFGSRRQEFFGYLAEMVAQRGQDDSVRKLVGVAKEGTSQEAPERSALLI